MPYHISTNSCGPGYDHVFIYRHRLSPAGLGVVMVVVGVVFQANGWRPGLIQRVIARCSTVAGRTRHPIWRRHMTRRRGYRLLAILPFFRSMGVSRVGAGVWMLFSAGGGRIAGPHPFTCIRISIKSVVGVPPQREVQADPSFQQKVPSTSGTNARPRHGIQTWPWVFVVSREESCIQQTQQWQRRAKWPGSFRGACSNRPCFECAMAGRSLRRAVFRPSTGHTRELGRT